MLNSDVYWITCEMDVTCDLLCWITTILTCMLVGLKSLVISLDYQSYMDSSVRIWLLRWLFFYLCSYNLVGSMTIMSINGHRSLVCETPLWELNHTSAVYPILWAAYFRDNQRSCGAKIAGFGSFDLKPDRCVVLRLKDSCRPNRRSEITTPSPL
jgi:hypothetical protein